MTLTVSKGPRAHPLFGHALELHTDPLGYLTRLAREYGSVVPLRFGPFPMLFVSEPSVIDEVLVQRARSFSKALTLRRLRPVDKRRRAMAPSATPDPTDVPPPASRRVRGDHGRRRGARYAAVAVRCGRRHPRRDDATDA